MIERGEGLFRQIKKLRINTRSAAEENIKNDFQSFCLSICFLCSAESKEMVFGKHFLLPSPILSGDILQKCSLFFTSVQFRTRVLVIFLSPDVAIYVFSQNLAHLKLVELVWHNICLISYIAKVTWGWWTGSRIFQRLCWSHPWGNSFCHDDFKMKMIR